VSENSHRQPFIFSCWFIFDESKIGESLHLQFSSDNALVDYFRSLGYLFDLLDYHTKYYPEFNVTVDSIKIKRPGGAVGSVDVIDKSDMCKLIDIINDDTKTTGKEVRSYEG
jgi:hypothetical protein